MLGLGCRSSSRIWFEKCDILTVLSLFILALAMFVINNFSFFQTNLSVHCVNTRLKKNLHKPLINPLNTELNPICHLLALLGAHPILHITRIRVKFIIVMDHLWPLMNVRDRQDIR